jgi:hypothetical protein
MTGWLKSLRDRPISDHERQRALAAVTALLFATTLLLALTRPAPHHAPRTSAAGARTAASRTRSPEPAPTAPPSSTPTPTVTRVSREFLAGYLAYLYGHAPVSQITGATSGLLHSLQAHPPRVSPAIRELAPRVLALYTTPAAAGLVGVSALVNDGGLVDYHVALLLTPHDGRLLVSALENA